MPWCGWSRVAPVGCDSCSHTGRVSATRLLGGVYPLSGTSLATQGAPPAPQVAGPCGRGFAGGRPALGFIEADSAQGPRRRDRLHLKADKIK